MHHKNLALFNLIAFLKGLYFYIPIIALFLLSKNVPLSSVVTSQVFYSLFVFIGEVPTGLIADRIGQKMSMVLGYLIEGFGIACIILFPTTWGLYVAFSIRGIGDSFQSGSEEALLYEAVKDSSPGNYQKIYGRFLSNQKTGFIISTALAGFAYQYWGEKSFIPLFILSASGFLLAGIFTLFLKDYKTPDGQAEGSGIFTALRQSFALIRHNNVVLVLTVVGLLTITGEFFLQSVYQPYFKVNEVPVFWAGIALSLGKVLNVFSTRYAYLLEEYFTLEKILLMLNITLGVAYILMVFLLHPVFLVGLYILMNGLFNLQVPIISDYINARSSSSIRTTVLSGISFIKRFFQIFLTLGLGALVGAFDTGTALIVQGLYLLLGMTMGYFLLVRCGCINKVRD